MDGRQEELQMEVASTSIRSTWDLFNSPFGNGNVEELANKNCRQRQEAASKRPESPKTSQQLLDLQSSSISADNLCEESAVYGNSTEKHADSFFESSDGHTTAFPTINEATNNTTSSSSSDEQPTSDNSTGATTPIDPTQPNDIDRSLAATNSSLPSTSEASVSLEAAKGVGPKLMSATKKEEEDLTLAVLKRFVISLAERFGETLTTVVDTLLEFLVKAAAAVSHQLVGMLEVLKAQEEEKKKEEQSASWFDQIQSWWAPPPPPKEPEGWLEKLASWWSPPAQQQPEPEGWLERLAALWATPAVKKEESSSSFFSVVAECFSSFC